MKQIVILLLTVFVSTTSIASQDSADLNQYAIDVPNMTNADGLNYKCLDACYLEARYCIDRCPKSDWLAMKTCIRDCNDYSYACMRNCNPR